MTTNMIFNIGFILCIIVGVIFMFVGLWDSRYWYGLPIAVIMAIASVFTMLAAHSTNARVETQSIPIVKLTATHYAIRKSGGLEYHKLPNTYRSTSGKSRIQKTKMLDFCIIAKNKDKIGATYYINNNQK